MTVLDFLKEYSSLVSALLSLAALGFLVHIANLIRNAAKDKIEVLEKENQILKDEVERTDKWHLRDIERLKSEIAESQERLKSSLKDADIGSDTFIFENSKEITTTLRESLESVVSEMLEKVEKAGRLTEIVNPNQYLELGRGLMAVGRWREAAEQLDKYSEVNPTDWKIQLSRGVSYANSRQGAETDLSALRAYNEAVAFIDYDLEFLDQNVKARLLTYRGAINKRLGRLDEAEADLNISNKLATKSYEIRDALYNMACIKAMKKDKEGLLNTLRLLKPHKGSHRQIRAINGHLKDYFATFASDPDFLELIKS